MLGKPPFALAVGEIVVATSIAASIKSTLSLTPGRLWLTSQRLEFTGNYGAQFGLVGMLVAKEGGMSLPLEEILSHERTSSGRNSDVLHVVACDGIEYMFVVDDLDAFAAALVVARRPS